MFSILKGLWSFAAKWLERYELFDFATSKFGFSAIVAKLAPWGGGIVIAIVAYIERAPRYVIVLVALAGVVLILAAIRLAQMISRDNEIAAKPIQANKREPAANKGYRARIVAPAPTIQSNTTGLISIAAAVIIGIVGTSLYNRWTSYNDKADQTRLNFSQGLRQFIPEQKLFFGINTGWVNSGPLSIRGVRYAHAFSYEHAELSAADLDKKFAPLDTELSQREIPFLDELSTGNVGWITFQDERFTKEDFQSMLDGSKLVYVLIQFRYEIDNITKDAEICFFFNKEYPSMHSCPAHNQTRIRN